MPLDLDSLPAGPLDLDAEPEAPGLISRAWEFATKPVQEHWKAAAPQYAGEIDRTYGQVQGILDYGLSPMAPINRTLALAERLAPNKITGLLSKVPTAGSLGKDASLLDAATLPAGGVGKLGAAGRLLEVAQAAGIGTEGMLQLNKARETGDWSEVPGGVVRLLLAKLGLGGSGGAAKASLDDVARQAEEAALSPFERQTRQLARASSDSPPTNFGGADVLQPPPAVSRFEAQSRSLADQMPTGGGVPQAPPPRSTRPLTYEEKLRATAANQKKPIGQAEGPPQPTVEQRFAQARQAVKAEGPLDLDALEASAGGPPSTSATVPPQSLPALGSGKNIGTQGNVPKGAETFEVAGGFQGVLNPKTGTYSLKGPNGEKVAGRLFADRIEMTSIGKGEAANSKGAVDALRQFANDRNLPVHFTSTNLSPSGGEFRKRMLARGDLVQRDGTLVLNGTGTPSTLSSVRTAADDVAIPTSDLETALQKSVEIAEPLKAGGATPAQITTQLKQERGGEAGFANVDLLTDAAKAANRGVGDFMRASVAGDVVTAIRNVQSGLRMVGQAMIEGPIAAGFEKFGALRAKAAGNATKSMELDRAAKLQMETAKAFGRATWEEGAATFADALSQLSGGRIKLGQGAGAFDARVKLMESAGDAKLASKLKSFSSTDVSGSEGGWRKGMMFLNILGDRFINRTFLRAHVDAAQKVFGAASPQQLEQMAARNPVIKNQLQEFLTNAGSEAFRASWQNPGAGALTKTAIAYLDATPLGLVVQPFAKAFFANMVPNVMEKIPLAAMASKRVRNSYQFHANKQLIETLGPAAKSDPTVAQKVKDLQKANREMAKDGIYAPSKIAARQVMGGLVVAAAVTRRLQSGDDGTEFDQMHIQSDADGKANKVASFTSQAGEDLPFWYLGDVIGHKILAEREGRPSKYDGKDGTTSIKGLMKAMYGSRYGVQTPAMDMVGALFSGKTEFDNQYIDRMAREVAGDLGKMAGSLSWAGGTARRVAAATNPEEAKLRRSDVTESRGPLARVKESFTEGVQSQIPGARQELPEVISWSKLGTATNVDPMAGATGGSLSEAQKLMDSGKPVSALLSLVPGSNRMEVSRLDRFANEHQGQVSLSEILPRRTQQPAYDQLVLKHLKAGLEKRALPALRSGKIDELSPEAQVTWFRNLSSIREDATEKAGREFRKLTGEYPEGELQRRQKKAEKRSQRRQMRRELRGVGYGRPSAAPLDFDQ